MSQREKVVLASEQGCTRQRMHRQRDRGEAVTSEVYRTLRKWKPQYFGSGVRIEEKV